MRRLILGASAAAMLASCGSWKLPTHLQGSVPNTGSVVPDTMLKLTPSTSIPLEKLVFWGAYASAAYLILDPLAPNWEIEEAKFPEDRYHMSLHMKRVYTGGAGEARAVFLARAKRLAEEGGFDGYDVIAYSEGMESSVLGSQRTAAGVVQLTKRND